MSELFDAVRKLGETHPLLEVIFYNLMIDEKQNIGVGLVLDADGARRYSRAFVLPVDSDISQDNLFRMLDNMAIDMTRKPH